MSLDRRTLLDRSLLATAALTLGSTRLLAANTSPFRWTDLEPGLTLVEGNGGNILVFSGREGVALVDGGTIPGARTLLRDVKDRSGQTPQLLFNTHCHRDQIGCNETLARAGATIVAHENTRLWLGTEIISKWENESYAPLPARALPNTTFWYDTQTLSFNGETLEYGHLPQAHTDGDIYVRFPARNLIMAGGVVASGHYPLPDYCTNGWIGGMIGSLQQLLALCDYNTRILGSSGGLVSRSQLQLQLDLCTDIATRLGEHLYKGGTYEEFVALKPTAAYDAVWGDPALFLHMVWEGALPHVTEIRRYGRRTG
jgi:glyoxylase-like metal-dependent hydrolase (beta-lactamase superfamily II)